MQKDHKSGKQPSRGSQIEKLATTTLTIANQDGELSQSKGKQKEQFSEVDNISTLVGLSETDFEYLSCKGAFTWPGDELRQVLFEAYMTVVHPNMPVLRIQQIIEIFFFNDGPGESFSLFLGQAMMAAASTAVMVEKIEALGFSSRQSMTEHFFQKGRVGDFLFMSYTDTFIPRSFIRG